MKTILIPTDFNTAALDCIPHLCAQAQENRLRFVFVHMFKLSDSITDLLMLSRRSREFERIDDEFYNRCRAIKVKYPQVEDIKIEFFYGSTVSMFKDFLEAHEVDSILDPADCFYTKINKSSIDPSVLLKKSGLPIVSVTITPEDATHELHVNEEEGQLAEA